jgi:hypothetical protein
MPGLEQNQFDIGRRAALPRNIIGAQQFGGNGAVTTGNSGAVSYFDSSANDRRPWAVPGLPETGLPETGLTETGLH